MLNKTALLPYPDLPARAFHIQAFNDQLMFVAAGHGRRGHDVDAV